MLWGKGTCYLLFSISVVLLMLRVPEVDKGGRTEIIDQLSMSARRTASDILLPLPRRYYRCFFQQGSATSARFWIARGGWPPRSHKGFGVASTGLFLVLLPLGFYLLPEGFLPPLLLKKEERISAAAGSCTGRAIARRASHEPG